MTTKDPRIEQLIAEKKKLFQLQNKMSKQPCQSELNIEHEALVQQKLEGERKIQEEPNVSEHQKTGQGLNRETFKKNNKEEDVQKISTNASSRRYKIYGLLVLGIIGIIYLSLAIPNMFEGKQDDKTKAKTSKNEMITLKDSHQSSPLKNINDSLKKQEDNHTKLFDKKSELVKSDKSDRNSYCIVVGSFSKLINAENYVLKLKDKGFNGASVIPNTSYQVSIGTFKTKKTSKLFQDSLKQCCSIEGWIKSIN
jgi:cell division protein FtsN